MSLDINPPPRRRIRPKTEAEPPPPEAAAMRDEEDKVGYGRPPKEHRWQKGMSGNPKGKIAGTKSLRKLIELELDTKIEVTERGKKRTRTKRHVAAVRIVNKAVEGDDKALTLLLKHEGVSSAVTSDTFVAANHPLSEGEQSILDDFMAAARQAVERELRDGESG